MDRDGEKQGTSSEYLPLSQLRASAVPPLFPSSGLSRALLLSSPLLSQRATPSNTPKTQESLPLSQFSVPTVLTKDASFPPPLPSYFFPRLPLFCSSSHSRDHPSSPIRNSTRALFVLPGHHHSSAPFASRRAAFQHWL